MKQVWNFENSYLQLPPTFYSTVTLNKVSEPSLVLFNESLARTLGINASAEQLVETLAGNSFPQDAAQIAQSYAGHQFGHFTMLGDGRAVLVGEQITPAHERLDIQLKGSGRTLFSRGGDGRAALGPMLREYIISEAMHALGIPTTRSLAVIKTGDPVYREVELQGAILTRVAKSHLRVGTFQYARHFGQAEDLKALADYAINRHYPEVKDAPNPYAKFLEAVIKNQANLVAQWQLVGFIHGVMNTDNMTISGETIDYGPCAFMDAFDPNTVFSSIDSQGRYAYGNQPSIAGWNLARLAESLIPLLHEDEKEALEIAQTILQTFSTYFFNAYNTGMRRKLGLSNEEAEDEKLAQQFLQLLLKYDADYTNSFRALTASVRPNESLFNTADFAQWETAWKARLTRQDLSVTQAYELMNATNAAVIPRNHRVEEALEAAEAGDLSLVLRLLQVLQTPYTISKEDEKYRDPMDDNDGTYQTYCGT